MKSPAPFPYLGAKARLLPILHTLIPINQDTYCEPFAGSLTVFFSRSRWAPREVVNDISEDVVNFFRVLRDQPDELMRVLSLTPYSRHETRLARHPAPGIAPLERARLFFVSNNQSFSATGRGFHFGAGGKDIAAQFYQKVNALSLFSARIKQAIIEHRPAIDLLDIYDSPTTVFYLDPPYLLRDTQHHDDMTRVYRGHAMTEADHGHLLEAANQCTGAVILSGFEHPIYSELLSDWQSVRVELRSITSHCDASNPPQIEIIWWNSRADELNPPRLL